MKAKHLFFTAAVACAAVWSFTSCSKEDNSSDLFITINFEGQQLGEEGFWSGDETGSKYENWGVTAYACNYTEKGVKFPVNYTPAWYSWSGFALSNRTETDFSFASLTPDQYNNVTGHAKSGQNFCVVQPYGESITFARPVTVKGFWYTNSAYSVYAILNGDGMTPGKFEADDWFKCILYPTTAEGDTGASYEIDLAKDGDYVKEWKYCNLRGVEGFQNVTSLSFGFDSTKKNAWGITTPAYVCIDDIEIEY